MPIQQFAFEVKELAETGRFRGWASVYDNIDQGADVVRRGAFARTLSESGKQRPLLWQHREPVGLVTLKDTAAGLEAEGQLSLGVQLARDAYELVKDGVVKGLSIGFLAVRDEMKNGVRQLLEVKLFEVSLTPFPMNEQATVTAVKSMQRGAITQAAEDLRRFYQNLKNS